MSTSNNACQCDIQSGNTLTIQNISGTTSDADCKTKCMQQYNTGAYKWSIDPNTLTKDANTVIRSIFIALAIITVFGVILWVVFFKGVASLIRAARRPKVSSPEFELSAGLF